MRGLEFHCNDEQSALLAALFDHIELDLFTFLIPESEVLKPEIIPIRIPNQISGKEFANIIKNGPYWIYNINIQAYPIHAQPKLVLEYADYMNSNCELVLFIVDRFYGELYVKDKYLLMQFIENLEAAACTNIQIKTDLEDGRTRFSVW